MASDLESEIRVLIVDVLNLDGLKPEEIDPEQDLFAAGGLELDSIDALEIGVGIQRKYGIKLSSEDKELRSHFRSVQSLAAFVAKTR